MNRFEIRDILKAHQEHFRVLPTLACDELNRVIQAIDNDKESEKLMPYSDWEQLKLSEQKANTLRDSKKKSDLITFEDAREMARRKKLRKTPAKKKGR